MTRPELIRKLVTTFHLNVAERREIGDAIPQWEVVNAILNVLLENGFYPPHVRPAQSGAPAYEGTILEMLPGGGCRAHVQWATAFGSLADVQTKDYADVHLAAIDLVAKDFVAGIDGVTLSRSQST